MRFTLSMQRDTQADTIAGEVPASTVTLWISEDTPRRG